jgi:hypothetical protein
VATEYDDKIDRMLGARDRKRDKKIKKITESTKQVTKGELVYIVKTIMREVLMDQVADFLNSTYGSKTLQNAILDTLSSEDGQDVIKQVIVSKMNAVTRLIEDVSLDGYLNREDLKQKINKMQKARKVKL